MAWATGSDLLKRYPAAVVGGLASDSGVAVAPGSIGSDPNVAAALKTATGKVKASIMQGGRYTIAQLEAMRTVGDPAYDADSAEYLTDIVCRVAFWLLWQRKPWSDQHENQRKQAETDSNVTLKQLRDGTEIFVIGTAIDPAGVLDGTGITAVSARNLWSNAPRGRFYPHRRTTS